MDNYGEFLDELKFRHKMRLSLFGETIKSGNIMKLYRICGIGAFAFVLGLAACGDDSSSNSDENGVKGEVITLADGSGEKVCDDKLEGWVAEAVGKDFRRCQNGEWTKITASEASAEDEIIGGVTVLQSSSSIIEESSSSSAPTEDLGSSSSVKAPEQFDEPVEPADGSSSSIASNANIKYGSLTDARDGQVYKTIEICNKEKQNCQTWMAENLNYAYTGVKYNYGGSTSDSTSWCYDNEASNCDTYGRFYTWAAAVDSVAIYKKYGEECGYFKSCERFSASALATTPVQGVCPAGWHLPSNAEWSTLYANVGGTSNAGQKLKANTSLWNSVSREGVTEEEICMAESILSVFSVPESKAAELKYSNIDEFGFSVLPAGQGDLGNVSYEAYFWSSTEYECVDDFVWVQFFEDYYDGVDQGNYEKFYKLSVRCVKD